MTHIYTYKYYSAIKKWTKNDIYGNMDGPRDYYANWSKLERERQISWYHLFVKSKTVIQMNLFTKQRQTQRCRRQSYGYQRGRGGDKLGVWD